MISHCLKQKLTVNCYHVVAAAMLEEAITALLCTVQVKTKHSMFQPALVWHGRISNKLKYRENTVTGYCPTAHTNRRHPSSSVLPSLSSHHAESIPKSRVSCFYSWDSRRVVLVVWDFTVPFRPFENTVSIQQRWIHTIKSQTSLSS